VPRDCFGGAATVPIAGAGQLVRGNVSRRPPTMPETGDVVHLTPSPAGREIGTSLLRR
jgi:hypothetical protein